MLGAALLAACLVSPEFGVTGPICPDPIDPCRCSTTLMWDPTGTAYDPAYKWTYEIQRTSPAGTIVYPGRQHAFDCTALDEATDACTSWTPRTYWETAKDCAYHTCVFPRQDATYDYRVRMCRCDGTLEPYTLLCNGTEVCSLAWSNSYQFVRGWDWYNCHDGQCWIMCWPEPCPYAPGFPR